MRIREYLVAALPEFALLLAACSALSFTVANGFEASAGLAGGLALVVAVDAVVLAALYAVAFNRRTLAAGTPLFVVACAAAVGGMVAVGGTDAFADEPGNAGLVALVAALVAVIGFAASRVRAGCALLAVAGCAACAVTELLFGEFHAVACVVFVGACAALFMYRTYSLGLRGTHTRHASFGAAALTCSLAALMAVGAACGVFFAIVEPLQPPTRDLVLVTEYLALEELPRRGVSQELAVTDPDLSSVVVGDRIDYLEPDESQDDEEKADEEEGSEEEEQASLQVFASAIGYNLDSIQQLFAAVTHESVWWGWVLVALVVCAVVASPFCVKLLLRRRFYRKALALPPRAYVGRVYGRVVRDLGRMGLPHAASATPYEYAVLRSPELESFTANDARANFALLTHVYVKASYGREPLTEGELVAVDAFWRAFFANCRARLGRGRYLRLFFRL